MPDLWSQVNGWNTGKRREYQLTDMRHGFCTTETLQNRRHVKVLEPKQTAVCGIDKVVIADVFSGVFAFAHVQDQLPFGRHTWFGFYDRKNIFPKSLDFFQGLLVVKIRICVNGLQ